MRQFLCLSLAALALNFGAGVAQAGGLDDFRASFAKAVYAGSSNLVHDRQPQALLRSVVVLNIKLGDDNRWHTDVIRTNDEQPEMLQRAIESVARARADNVPAELRDELKRRGMYETWLFDKDGSFQVKTLARPQVFADN